MKALLQQERIKLGQMLDGCRKCTDLPNIAKQSELKWCGQYCDVPGKIKAQMERIESLQKEDRLRRNVKALVVDEDLKDDELEEIFELPNPTFETFLNLRVQGITRSEIASKYFHVGPRKMDQLLEDWGIRHPRDERKVMSQYKQKLMSKSNRKWSETGMDVMNNSNSLIFGKLGSGRGYRSATVEHVLTALKELRVSNVEDEYTLQNKIREQFEKHKFLFQKEYRLAPRNRVDFLIYGGIAVEVKRGLQKPNRSKVLQQLERYASSEEITSIILVVDRNLDLPSEINGKPCVVFGLHKLWGIAL